VLNNDSVQELAISLIIIRYVLHVVQESHEKVIFTIVEGCMIVLACLLLTAFHPGRIFVWESPKKADVEAVKEPGPCKTCMMNKDPHARESSQH